MSEKLDVFNAFCISEQQCCMEIDSVLSRFLLHNHCRVQCIPMMFVLPSVVSEHSSRLIGDSTVRRATVLDGSRKRVSLAVIHTTRCLVVFGVFLFSPCVDMYHGSGDSLVWRWILRCMNLWLVLWTRQDRERFYVSSVYLVINTELCLSTEYRIWTQISRVHSPVVEGG